VPKIANTQEELKWSPRVSMKDAMRHIFDAYRDQVTQARALVE
jgi:hypothetical protein